MCLTQIRLIFFFHYLMITGFNQSFLLVFLCQIFIHMNKTTGCDLIAEASSVFIGKFMLERIKRSQVVLGCLMFCPVECQISPRMEITPLLWASVQCLSTLTVKMFLPKTWLEFSMLQLVCVASHPVTMHFWEESGSIHLQLYFLLGCVWRGK